METWTTNQLVDELNRRQGIGIIQQWAVREDACTREERYFIRDDRDVISLDQSRSVVDSQLLVSVQVTKGERMGTAQKRFFPSIPLLAQIDSLAQSAALNDEEIWHYEANPAQKRISQNRADPLIWENVLTSTDRLSKGLAEAVRSIQTADFNSAELFVAKKKETLRLANGFIGEEFACHIYAEVCFAYTDSATGKSEEYMVRRGGARSEQIDFLSMCRESAELSKRSLDVRKPEPGKYSVMLSSSEICLIMHDLFSQLQGASKYLGWPYIEKGQQLIENFSGGKFRLAIDPEMGHAFSSRTFDGFGDPQKRRLLVDNNLVLENSFNRKYATYLQQVPTTSIGVLVVDADTVHTEAQMRKLKPKVLEILQLSALFTDSHDLSFASEIRLARLHDRETGESHYIKGGSISGNFRENFSQVQWSDRKRLENIDDMNGPQSFFGPSFALLNDVSVTS